MNEAIVETRGIGSPYQTVIKLEDSGPRIHIFWRGDADPDCHDHPADFWTFPLVSYIEQTSDGSLHIVKAFRLHRRKAEYAHRVVGSYEGRWQPPEGPLSRIPLMGQRVIVTLVWWGKKRREWGFHTPRGWVPWREYLGVPA